MKKNLLVFVFLFAIGNVYAQVASISEDFSGTTVGNHHPDGWLTSNPVLGTDPDGMWTIGVDNGRDNTRGIQCTGYYSGTGHLDTSFLISPLLSLASYPSSVYLNFDTKTTNIHLGARLEVVVSHDSLAADSAASVALAMMPPIGPSDSSDWTTHQIDLTSLKPFSPFYIAFRYTSATSIVFSSIWFLDNIYTTETPLLTVPGLDYAKMPLSINAHASSDAVTVFYNAPATGKYQLALCDVAGRVITTKEASIAAGNGKLTVDGMALAPGMYFAKLTNGELAATAKCIVY